jgi:hypothetical protein
METRLLQRGELTRQAAFAAGSGVAVDGAAFYGAIQFRG